MSDMTLKKDKREYGVIQNMAYLIKNIWKWNNVLFWMSVFQIPAIVIIPLLGIYIPKVLIDSIIGGTGAKELLINMAFPILGIILLTITLKSLGGMTNLRRIKHRFKYMELQIDKIVDTDFENIDGPEGQKKITKAGMAIFSNDSATEAFIGTTVEFFSNIIGFIIYAGIIATIHPLIVVFIIVSSMINYFIGKYVNSYEHKNKDNLAPIEQKLRYIREKTGEFKSAKDMRLYNMSNWFKEMFNLLINERLQFQKKNAYRRYSANIVDGILILLRDGLTYAFLIYSVIYRNMEIGNFVLYFGAVAGFSTWLSGIVSNINSINSISLSTGDLRDYLEMEDKMNRGEGAALPKSFELPCDIELKDVYYKYPGAEEYTIRGIDLYIKKGEKLALVGVNGAGKTTLVKLICGLYTPTSGEILINGVSSSLYNRDEYYSLFSVAFQDIHLLPISIERNISFQSKDKIDYEKLSRVIRTSGLDEKLKLLPKGKETLLVKSIYKDAVELSGGEMQKLMLARALYKDGPIIILDEPTAALDPIAENEIYEKYNDLTREKTSVFISHRLSSTRFCDRIIFIEDGKVIEEGDHYALMKKGGKYSEMYEMQSHYYKDNIGGVKDES